MTTRSGRLAAGALLLDMDGVLVDSTGLVEINWARWARRQGLEPAEVLVHAHGTPSREVVARFVDPDEVAAEAAWVEELGLEAEEETALPGAADVLRQTMLPVAVVTSATAGVAVVRLRKAGLSRPDVLISADDVTRGKPDPEPYALGASRLGVDPGSCVGVEDTPAGVRAILAAGATPIALMTSHQADQLSQAAVVLSDLSGLRIDPGGVSWDSDADH